MESLILGLHHVTATVDAAQADLDFSVDALGLRLVKKVVTDAVLRHPAAVSAKWEGSLRLQVSPGCADHGLFQSVAGSIITAAYTVPNAVIHPSPGRDLAAGARGTYLVNLVQPGTQYGDRMNQLDLRVTKLFRVGGARRLELMADFYNALNASPALTLSATYGRIG